MTEWWGRSHVVQLFCNYSSVNQMNSGCLTSNYPTRSWFLAGRKKTQYSLLQKLKEISTNWYHSSFQSKHINTNKWQRRNAGILSLWRSAPITTTPKGFFNHSLVLNTTNALLFLKCNLSLWWGKIACIHHMSQGASFSCQIRKNDLICRRWRDVYRALCRAKTAFNLTIDPG